MLFLCWASVADSDTTLNKQRDKSMCVLCTLNEIPFDKQIYISILKLQKLSGEFGNLKPEVRSLNLQFRVAAKKTHTRNSNQSVIIKITQPNLKWPPQKLIKPSPNIIVT